MQDTPAASVAPSWPLVSGVGVVCTAHVVPFHRSARVRVFLPLRVLTSPVAVHWARPVQDTPISSAPVNMAAAADACVIIACSPAAPGRVPNLSHRAPGPSSLVTALLPGVPVLALRAAVAAAAGPAAAASVQAAIMVTTAARPVMPSSAGLVPLRSVQHIKDAQSHPLVGITP